MDAYLYERIDINREEGLYKGLPDYIPNNLSPKYELREYQKTAFQNFITYFESKSMRYYPAQVLFHMATGSGKTLIMAGLMLYLYKQGYRNFIFFVNSTNIVKKTKENFLNHSYSKYQFADSINIDGEQIEIKEVENFQCCDPNAINIYFTTTQGLHSDMMNVKENTVTFDDFQNQKVVLISDEAHHVNSLTKKGLTEKEKLEINSWEYTVDRIFISNKDNVLLEFTATCDLENTDIKRKYLKKIVCNYPLKNFRGDGFSKEINTLMMDTENKFHRALQAVLLSQYRMKLFQKNRIFIKPVILFKSEYINESNNFMREFIEKIKNLHEEDIVLLKENASHPTLKKMFAYFDEININYRQLIQELKEAFSEDKCISVNNDNEIINSQIIVNTLENEDNPYRAVFAVDKLDEGWDVLNLFDIVRLSDSPKGKSGMQKTTMREAQLIGRGARYCPFKISDEQETYKRKYDEDLDNPLRICEELYYHSVNDSKYIAELKSALIETGAMSSERQIKRTYTLKDDFIHDDLYRYGKIFTNKLIPKSRKEVFGLPESIISKEHRFRIGTMTSKIEPLFDDETFIDSDTLNTPSVPDVFYIKTTVGKISKINYSIVHSALRKYDVFKFNTLKSYFPNLESTRQFITDNSYLGDIKIVIESSNEEVSPKTYYAAVVDVLSKIANHLYGIEKTYEGSKEFSDKPLKEVVCNKSRNYPEPKPSSEGEGVSQNHSDVRPEWRIDLSKEDWFVFEDNYGTSEEKSFVAYFKERIRELKEKYDKVYLIRNERHFAIYSFDDGERFEPDYLLFLLKNNEEGYVQYQIFIEPKGEHLFEIDSWKESFLKKIESEGVITQQFINDNKYLVWGFPFYNSESPEKINAFSDSFNKLL